MCVSPLLAGGTPECVCVCVCVCVFCLLVELLSVCVCVCVCVFCLLVELLMPTPKLAASLHPQHPSWSLVRGECLGKTC